jgi:polyhydroxyalkanoate synthesis regulator phasin
MPKKKHPETPEEQSKRFQAEAERLIAAGELDPDEAERAVDQMVRRAKANRKH